MKKLISIILASLILLTNVCVFAEGITEKQLSELKKYNIMTGDPDGNMRLEDNLTRAEAVKMILAVMNYTNEANNVTGTSKFPDVWETYWAKPLINYAADIEIYNIKLIQGDEHGNFNPEDNVTNEELVKMLAVILGYGPMAEQTGGFPVGYLMVGARFGITNGLTLKTNSPATREDAGIMIANSLDIPIMVQTHYGRDESFAVMDGSGGTRKATMKTEYLGETEAE